MRLAVVARVFVLSLLLTIQNTLSASASVPSNAGVFVEQVEHGSEAENAGIKVGDRILAWSRESTNGSIESPFDWSDVLTEQAPRGNVVLQGFREGQAKSWSLGIRSWGLTVEPNLQARLMASFHACRQLTASQNYRQAEQCWSSMLRSYERTEPQWLPSFLLLQIAESLTKQERWPETDRAYREALERSRPAGEQVTVQVLESWGVATWLRGDLDQASEHCSSALAIRERLAPDSLAVAKVLSDCGDVALNHDDLAKAEELYLKAKAIRDRLSPGSLSAAGSMRSIGNLAWLRGDLAKADEYHRQALALCEKLAPGSLVAAGSLVPIGLVAWRRGELASAEKYLHQALDIYNELSPNSHNVAATVNNIGLIAWSRGDLSNAEEDFREALAVQQRLAPGSLEVAAKLSNLSLVAEQRGDLSVAESYQRQALAIRQKQNARGGLAESLINIGQLALDHGDRRKAENFFRQALAIREELAPGSMLVTEVLSDLGSVARGNGDMVEAEQYYLQALAINQTLAPGGIDVAMNLNDLGRIAQDRNDHAKAEDNYVRALTICEKLAPGTLTHADVLHNLGLLYRDQGNVGAAEQYLARSVDAFELQAAHLGGGQEVQAGFQSQQAHYYEDYLEILLLQNKFDAAFLVTERSRARTLLAMLAERDLLIDADLPAEIVHARKLNATAYDEVQGRLSKLTPAKDSSQIEQLVCQLRDLNEERERLVERARQASPRIANLRYPQPLDVAATRQILDEGTALLSFFVGQDRTVLFLVRRDGSGSELSVVTLPVGKKTLVKQVEDLRTAISERRTANDRILATRARSLYDELIKPVESLIDDSRRLVVVPDGPLHVLPFQALMRTEGKYLVEWKPLNTVASATVYAELKKTRNPPVGSVELVAFGDPYYPTPASQHSRPVNDVETRSAMQRGLSFSRLPFSRMEVDSIAALYSGRSQKYLGAQATEKRAKSLGKDVRYVHFAVHGLLDERFPLNSALVLAIPAKVTKGQENGLLQAWEIFEQMRINADLVTLSACKTGLGQEFTGEGLLGLTRAFQFAGARSVMGTLWSVDDFQTMRLMRLFYGELRAGNSKDKALQAAQLQLLRSKGATAPYYWAGFVLFGDSL